jgi:hypothetical protein
MAPVFVEIEDDQVLAQKIDRATTRACLKNQ